MTSPNKTPDELLEEILERDRRYDREAYAFVSQALGYTVQRLERRGHVTGRELCEGVRDFALEQFGRLARTVLASWGLSGSEDVGEIVFNMVDVGLLRKTDEDTRADFAGVLDLGQALEEEWRIELAPGNDDDEDDG